jgi:Flp pilus assembly protein TadG
MRWLTGPRRDCRGGAAIEFAILAPVLFTILLGTVEMGRMFYVRQALEYATEQAARYYMVTPGATTSGVQGYLQSQMAGGMGNNVTVSIYDDCSANGVLCKRIHATYSFTFVAAFLGLSGMTMSANAQAVVN